MRINKLNTHHHEKRNNNVIYKLYSELETFLPKLSRYCQPALKLLSKTITIKYDKIPYIMQH
jgi:hypothetical protein